MNVTSLPAGGANFRVFKTTANGSSFFGNPVALTVGVNTITVAAVTFDRAVKFQFSSGDVEFDALTLNGVASSCVGTTPPPTTSLISDCGDFVSGPSAWPYVLVATTIADGAASQGSQTFEMNVTSLPAGGANFRVFKTTANGSSFFGNPVALTVGVNTITVAAVSFDRAVKFQFSSGDVEFDALTLNGVASSCVGTIPSVPGCTDSTATNYDPTATTDDGSCTYCYQAVVNFSVDAGAVVSSSYDNVVINGNFSNWNGWGVTLTDADGDGVYEGSLTVDAGTYEYVHALTGSGDGWSGWGVPGNAPTACQVPGTGNYGFTVNCGDTLTLPTVCFASCDPCAVSGCTDVNATNYDATATIDDGSCTYPPLIITTTVCDGASSVVMTGPWWNWDPNSGPVAVDNGDSTFTFTFDPAPTADMEYLLIVDGVQEDLTAANTASGDWSCTPITDYWSYK